MDDLVQRTRKLSEYLNSAYLPEQEAITEIWEKSFSELPSPIRNLPYERAESIVACYADCIFLTMEKYPEQLTKGYLWLTDCDPSDPGPSTEYASDKCDIFIGRNLLNWCFGHNEIELRKNFIRLPGFPELSPDKPLFVAINHLRTDHMPEMLVHYRTFRETRILGTEE